MDSPIVKEYKKQIQTLFSRAKVHGFVDWWHMGPLTSGILDLMDDVICRLADEKEQKKVLDFLMKHTDGKVIDYMEDYLYRFMDTDFFGES